MSVQKNLERAERIDRALDAYRGNEPVDICDAQDLLTDLMHWCNRGNIDFGYMLEVARRHFEAEVNEY